MDVEVKVFALPGATLPAQATPGAAGFDLAARLMGMALVIAPGDRQIVHTGVHVQIPDGYEGQVRSRSGLAKEHGVIVLNAPGTIDSDYRGEIAVILHNTSRVAYTVRPGDRIAQLVIAPVPAVRLAVVASAADLEATTRGEGGFGSTGLGALGGDLGPSSDALPGQLGLFGGVATGSDGSDGSDDKNDNTAGDRGPMEV